MKNMCMNEGDKCEWKRLCKWRRWVWMKEMNMMRF